MTRTPTHASKPVTGKALEGVLKTSSPARGHGYLIGVRNDYTLGHNQHLT